MRWAWIFAAVMVAAGTASAGVPCRDQTEEERAAEAIGGAPPPGEVACLAMMEAPVSPAPVPRPGVAFALTAASSLFFGPIPSPGHVYAGETRRAVTSYGLRLGGEGALVAGVGLAVYDLVKSPRDPETDRKACSHGIVTNCAGGGLALAGLGLALGTLTFDLIDAPLAAYRAQRRGQKPWPQGAKPLLAPFPLR